MSGWSRPASPTRAIGHGIRTIESTLHEQLPCPAGHADIVLPLPTQREHFDLQGALRGRDLGFVAVPASIAGEPSIGNTRATCECGPPPLDRMTSGWPLEGRVPGRFWNKASTRTPGMHIGSALPGPERKPTFDHSALINGTSDDVYAHSGSPIEDQRPYLLGFHSRPLSSVSKLQSVH